MKTNKWIATLNTEVFDYYLKIPITKDNFIEKIYTIEETILKYGNKFNILKIIPDFLLNRYKQNKFNAYKRLKKSDFIFLFDFDLCTDEKIKIKDLEEEEANFYMYSEEGEVILKSFNLTENIIFYTLGDAVTYEEIQQNDVNEISIVFCSDSNIWFDEVDSENIIAYSENKEENEDNIELALLNTPRLNSFFREIKQVTEKLGGKWSLETNYPDKVTEDGILIDGRIIYQEDIDKNNRVL